MSAFNPCDAESTRNYIMMLLATRYTQDPNDKWLTKPKFIKKYRTVREEVEFENEEPAPLWKDVDVKYRYVVFAKSRSMFDGTGGEVFQRRVRRKSGTKIVGYFEDKEEAYNHPLLEGYCPSWLNVFVFDRAAEGQDWDDECVNGAY